MKLDIGDMCFACGQKNPIGLKLAFHLDGDEYVTTFQVRREHQGWAGIAHGGLVATVLDETMTRFLWEKDINSVTARLQVRYRHPIHVGDLLEIRGRIVRLRPPLIEMAAVATANGVIVAEATASSMKL
ncbi:MAG: PaaI family thioesterase [Armatimonadota bacterium]|jgi:acyl-coenzyme A thioesterase PaaI-like protein